MKNKDSLVIVVLYYIGWFGSIFLARTDFSGFSLFFPFILMTFLYLRKSINLKNLILAVCVSFFGILFDFSLIHFGFVTAAGELVLLIPLWRISIWLLFSFSMIKLGQSLNLPLWLSALLVLIMGPLSYKSREAFEVLSFSSSVVFLIYACFWGLAFPLILSLSRRAISK